MPGCLKLNLLYISLLLIGGFALSQTGTLYNRSFEHSATVRTYSLYVPASYSESEKWPLIINYHGYAADIDDQITRTNMNTMADTAHFIIAYPQGLTIERSADVLPAWVPASGQGWHARWLTRRGASGRTPTRQRSGRARVRPCQT